MSNELIINKTVIRHRVIDGVKQWCGTDLWRAAAHLMPDGKPPENKRPNEWARKAGKQFIEFVAQKLNTANGRIYQSEKGVNGATWMIEELMVEFAGYLDNAFKLHVIETFLKYTRGELVEPLFAAEVQDFSPDARNVHGGIVKSVVTKQLVPFIERFDEMSGRFLAMEERLAAIEQAEETVFRNHRTSAQVILLAGVKDGNTGGLSKKVRDALEELSSKMGIPVRWKEKDSGKGDIPYFHNDVVYAYLDGPDKGREYILRKTAERRDKIKGQGRLPFSVVRNPLRGEPEGVA